MIDFKQAFLWLRKKWQVNRLLCEGGGDLNSSLLASGLVNELYLTICPLLLGGRHAATIRDGEGFDNLAQAIGLRMKSIRTIQGEAFLAYELAAP